jgi:hypothetical protein
MKIIKSFLLVAVMLFATNLLHAQEAKAEVGKPIEPKQSTADNRPSPVLKPQDAVVPSAPAKVAEIPSPKEEPKSAGELPKPVVKTIETNPAIKTLTAENLRTLEGKTDKPKPVVLKGQ